MKHIAFTCSFLSCLFLFAGSTLQAQNIYLVDSARPYSNTPVAVTTVNASAWAAATSNLQAAINAAGSSDQVWVAKGTYLPVAGASFSMKAGVKIYGGFANTATSLGQRNFRAYTTILKGNGSSVVRNFSSSLSASAVLDGFTVTGGNDNRGGGMYNFSSSPTITNCTFSGNNSDIGGGMFNESSSPTITNCTFSGNNCNSHGGGMENNGSSSPTITNCTFSGNNSNYVGGGMYNSTSSPTITNCTFSGNNSNYIGGGIFNYITSSPTITNCVFWGNTPANTTVVDYENGSTSVITYSLVQGGYSGTGNIDSDPLFVNSADADGADNIFGTADDGLRLYAGSPAIDRGSNSAVSGTTDITGAARIQNGKVDMGAYESYTCLASAIVYVDNSKDASGNGSSWANAYKEVSSAFTAAGQCSNITTVYVAKGTYKPTSDANRDSAFTLLWGGVKIYGGYPNGGGARNIAANPTILSGDIGTANTASDNSYHVMVIAGLTSAADSVVLDGFTITGGNANGNGNSRSYNGAPVINNEGAGLYLHSNNGAGGKIAVRNCIFSNNTANNFGGGFYNQLSSPAISNCTITNNTAHDGAGMFNYNAAAPVITNCVFAANTALGNGGGIYNLSNTPSALLVNCTFQGNTAATAGAVCNDMSAPTIINSIIWGNSTAFNNQPIPVTYSLVQNGYTGTGNINTNPLFVNSADADGADNIFGTADDGLQIQVGSPAGNAGKNAAIPAGITTDITGAARIQNGIVDMGAYENGTIILPLTLVQFSGKGVNSSDAQLQWKTANEVNVSHFELQRSADGRSFSTITQVQAKGNTTSETDYSYAEKNLPAGRYYYRLCMVDKDGKETYSGVVIIILSKAGTITLYPVPVKEIIWLGGNGANHTGKQALLMDIQSRLLQTLRIVDWPQRVDVSALAPGTYLVKIEGEKALSFIKP